MQKMSYKKNERGNLSNMSKEKKSIKEYTKFVAEKCNTDLDDEDIDKIMMSFGFRHNEEITI